jgi:hypothetical protein
MTTAHTDLHQCHRTMLSRVAMRGTGTRLVYGEPVEQGGVTVIPVARTMWTFGGGSDGPPGSERAGAGGGGGGITMPVGYIRIRTGKRPSGPSSALGRCSWRRPSWASPWRGAGAGSDSQPDRHARRYDAPEPKWRNGRRSGLKIRRPQGRVGSTPTFGTTSEPTTGDDSA